MPRHVPLAIPTPSPRRSPSTTSGSRGKAAREGLLTPPWLLSGMPTGTPSPTRCRRPISGNRAALAAQHGLPLGLDSTIGQRDIAVKTVGFPILPMT